MRRSRRAFVFALTPLRLLAAAQGRRRPRRQRDDPVADGRNQLPDPIANSGNVPEDTDWDCLPRDDRPEKWRR